VEQNLKVLKQDNPVVVLGYRHNSLEFDISSKIYNGGRYVGLIHTA